MEFFDTLKARRSIRQFTDRAVSADEIMKLVDAAISAPNACNMQSWHFYVVTDAAVKVKLAEEKVVAEWATTAPVIFVVCTAAEKICERFGKIGEELFAIQDTAAAIENILLCAADMGLGGCFMGAFDQEKVRRIVGMRDEHKPVAMVPIGEPANILPPRPRNPVEYAVTFVGSPENGSYREADTTYRKYEVKNVNQPDAVFENVGLKHLKVKCGNLSEAEFDDVNLSSSKFNNVNLSDTSYSDINMKKCSYGGLTMEGSSFGCVEMNGCKFENVVFDGSTFKNCSFENTTYENCNIKTGK